MTAVLADFRRRAEGIGRRARASERQSPPVDPKSSPIPDESQPGLSINEFRRRIATGEADMDRWAECSIDPSQVDGLDGDPTTAAYADAVFSTWSAITGRDQYAPAVDEVFDLGGFDYLTRPYPYCSGNPSEVANYLGAVAAAVGRMGCPPDAKVIEYGSGWGHLAIALSTLEYAVVAVDLNPGSVDLLRRRAALLGVPLHVEQCGFLEYDPPEPVDVIVFFESFHHCQHPFELLDRCRAQLAPGGRILFLAEAVYDEFYAPWGVRLDGSATITAAHHGWLELGFRRDFFTDQLCDRGFEVTWELMPWLGDYGTLLTATLPVGAASP